MEAYKNTTVLVTGATGFLARHLIHSLLSRGADVIGLSLEKKISGSPKNFSYFQADLKNKKEVNLIIKKTWPKKIFHLAAYPDKEPTFENTGRCIQNNVLGTLNLIHSLKNAPYDSFIHIGSYKEYYGNKAPYKETDPIYPVSPYAISKACAEMLGKAYYELYDKPFTSIRLPTIYGPAQSRQNLIPHLITACLNNNPLKLTKGEQGRELIYVSDAIEALQKAALNKKAYGEIINIGTNEEHKLKEIVNLVLELTNSKVKPEFGAIPYRKHELWHMRGDNKKAQKLLNWRPKVGIRQGLMQTIEYYKNA